LKLNPSEEGEEVFGSEEECMEVEYAYDDRLCIVGCDGAGIHRELEEGHWNPGVMNKAEPMKEGSRGFGMPTLTEKIKELWKNEEDKQDLLVLLRRWGRECCKVDDVTGLTKHLLVQLLFASKAFSVQNVLGEVVARNHRGIFLLQPVASPEFQACEPLFRHIKRHVRQLNNSGFSVMRKKVIGILESDKWDIGSKFAIPFCAVVF